MENKPIKVNDSFIINSLRNCGYNNYTAIADIIDNSIEPEVGSSFVRVDFETEGSGKEKATVKSILIIDDGIGMPTNVLEEAMTLGSNTGKNCTDNLGMYGTGLKSASLSIGQVLEVFTKTEDSSLNYAKLSIEDAIENDNAIVVEYKIFDCDSEEYQYFKKNVESTHGTIIKISHLDRLSNKNYYSFKGTLKDKIGEIFNKYIFSNVVKFYVGKGKDSEVPFIDLMTTDCTSNICMGEDGFEVDGHYVKFKAYYLPMNGKDINDNEEAHTPTSNCRDTLARNEHNSGLYIYRNNRLVGRGLILGIYKSDPWKNGFRCEIFIDGGCDALFGSSFTKMIQERSQDYMSQSLLDKLKNKIGPFVREAASRQRQETDDRKSEDPEVKKVNDEFYKKVTEKQNKNMMLKANRKGENKKNEEKEENDRKIRGKQKNPNPIKERTNKWLGGFEERPLGPWGEMFTIEHNMNKPLIIINTDHAFYKEFYSRLDNDMKFIMAQIISCEEIAKQNVNYYNSEEVRKHIDAFNESKSGEILKSLCY